MDLLERLQYWYKNQCNDEWECSGGIKIESLDSPGWKLQIDLDDTPLEGIELNVSKINSRLDWYRIQILNNKFHACCDPSKLNFLIEYFFNEVLNKTKLDGIEYDMLIPIKSESFNAWIIGGAIMINVNEFKIVRLNKTKSNLKCLTAEDYSKVLKVFNNCEVKYEVGDIFTTELVETFPDIYPALKETNSNKI